MKECRKAQLNMLGETGKALRSFEGGRGSWRIEMGIVGDQEQHEQRHRDLNVQE